VACSQILGLGWTSVWKEKSVKFCRKIKDLGVSGAFACGVFANSWTRTSKSLKFHRKNPDLGVSGAFACGVFANSRTRLDLNMGRKT